MPLPAQQASPLIEKLNPLHYMTPEQFTSLLQKFFATIFHGFWARVFFFSALFIAFYAAVRQRNPSLAVIGIVIAAITAYGAGVAMAVRSFHW